MAEIRGNSTNNRLTGTNQNDSIFGLGGDDTLSGLGGVDLLDGGNGNDVLDGGAGGDTMRGGGGNDTYVVDQSGDQVAESDGQGIDSVRASISYTLGNNLENLTLTGSASINGVGNSLDNIIVGNEAANFLNGQSGNDTLSGGGGDDSMVGGDGNDTAFGGTGNDSIQGDAGNDFLQGDVGNDSLRGGVGSDSLLGGDGDDVLDGGASADSMTGGAGNDFYIVDDIRDVVNEGSGGGYDTVSTAVSFAVGGEVEQILLSGTGSINAIGSGVNNRIVGNTGNNVLTGGDGNDELLGAAGNDTLLGGNGNDALNGGAGADQMNGGAGNDTYFVENGADSITEAANGGIDTVVSDISYGLSAELENLSLTGSANLSGAGNSLANSLIGNAGSNQLVGGFGNDYLDGGASNDVLLGGAGNDIYIVDNLGDSITENFGEGVDTVITSLTFYSLGTHLENLTFSGNGNTIGLGNGENNVVTGNGGNNTLLGNDGDDTLIGGAGNDFLDGGTGIDSLIGGVGNDTYIINDSTDTITEDSNGGTDTIFSSLNYTLGANVEHLTLVGAEDLEATGNADNNQIIGNSGSNSIFGDVGADTLVGNQGNDILNGGGGADTLTGGEGDDTYVVDDAGDRVIELAGEGADAVRTFASFDLSTNGDNVENLTLLGSGNINGVGNALGNTIIGNSGNNTLNGAGGDDSIDGGVGADTMLGGAGNDTYFFDNANDNASESAGQGTDTVFANSTAAATFTIGDNVETLTLQGTADLNGTGGNTANTIVGNSGKNILNGRGGNDLLLGNDGNDTLLGGSGNDELDGGVGADAMSGGAGDDFYSVENPGDTVTENVNEGIDTVSAASSFELAENLENLTLTGTGDFNGTGNSTGNTIVGNSGNNILNGGGGADTLTGGAGNDTYEVDNTNDVIVENVDEGVDGINSSATFTLTANLETLTLTGTGNIDGTGNAVANTILGNSGNNSLQGAAGNDVLVGNDGDDVLDGGSGDDTMTGGNGNDTYVVDTVGDTVTETGTGIDAVRASITYSLATQALNVENLTLTGSANINGTGSDAANTIVGNTGNNVLSSGLGNDSLSGDAGNDTLDGGAGDDAMSGGSGDDIYIVDTAGDRVTEATGEGTDLVRSGVSYTLDVNVENLSLTGTANIDGTGNSLNNTITGNSGSNVLDGKAGADTLIGGDGNDTYLVDNTSDRVVEALNEGIDTIESNVSFNLATNGANVENLTLVGGTNGIGNTLNNTIIGNNANNLLDGGAGADSLSAGSGDDTYVVDNVGDTITENSTAGIDSVQSSVAFTLGANLENLTLTGTSNINGTGNALANTILGNSGNNTLDGGAGADDLRGGLGDDTYVLDNANDKVTENASEGTDTVRVGLSYTLGTNFENLTLLGTGNFDGTGNAGNNTIAGNSGNNILDGKAGADTLIGGDGDDLYVVDDSGDTVTELGTGLDVVRSSVSFSLDQPNAENIENLTLTGTANINGTGNSQANMIVGNSGNNVLDGKGGLDSLIGGAGDDTYIVDNVGEITENANEGIDTVRSSVSFTLGANLEHLTLIGTNNIDGTGNEFDNTIAGNSGNNVIDGAIGADIMRGGGGNDTYFVDDAGDVVIEGSNEGTDSVNSLLTHTLSANIENLTLIGTANIDGIGNSLNNTLVGNGGNNRLDGQGGADAMSGGAGNDTYIVDDSGDTVTEAASQGSDSVESGVSFTLSANIETLTLTGSANINGTGNTLNNTIIGNSGNNTLNGGTGEDVLIGGAGDDTYVVDNPGDAITENAGEGIDTVQSSITYILGENLENLRLTGTTAIDGTGNSLDNTIIGNSANNTLDGKAGADTLIGGAGDDLYIIDDAGDSVTESANEGTDTIRSSISFNLSTKGINVENLTLTGTANIDGTGSNISNTIVGNSGNNRINGGAGVDVMIGGAGDDTYTVDTAGETVTEDVDQGIDTVLSGVDFALGVNLENLTLTGTSNINGTGNGLDNTIVGNSGNNRLDGGTGSDVLIGGAGDDTYVVDVAGDSLTEAAGEGTDTVLSAVSFTLAANFENLSLTGTGNIDGTGNGVVNTIAGNSGNNRLDGGAGADVLIGGLGDDTYAVDNVGDSITETGSGIDTVEASITYTLAGNLENLTLTGTAALNGTGNTVNNTIVGNSAVNTLTGGAGDDTLNGGAGADTLIGGIGDDVYVVDNPGDVITENPGEGDNDTVTATDSYGLGENLESLTLLGTADINGTGNNTANTIVGNSGNNVLNGGQSGDRLIGGAGDDTYVVDSVGDTVVESANQGTDTVRSGISFNLATSGANVENLTLTGTADIDGTGNGIGNTIAGNSGKNRLDGGGGIDSLIGGDGDDTYVIDNSSDSITEVVGEGTDTVESGVTYTLSANLENLTLTGTTDISGTGNSTANTIVGNSSINTLSGGGGNDYLDGGAGADTMIGGGGNDTFIVDTSSDRVSENPNDGIDTIRSTVSFNLATNGANVENLILLGSATTGTGNSLDNTITGNDANNVLDGGAGSDRLTGGIGNDTYTVDSSSDEVVEKDAEGTDIVNASVSYILGDYVENLTLTGSADIDGTGNALANTIVGNGGSNVLDGAAGADRLIGGLGNDTYRIDEGGDVIVENFDEGNDTVVANFSFDLSISAPNVENLTLTGTGNFNGTGNSVRNTIMGNSGNNALNGGGGNDVLIGGGGNDTYTVDSALDEIIEQSGGGTDVVRSTVSYVLGANIESLTLLGTGGIDGTGNAEVNTIVGNSGSNVLDGKAGADVLRGGAGDDTYIYDGTDIIFESLGEGIDTVESSVTFILDDTLENLALTGSTAIDGTGNQFINTIIGNGADNVLQGLGDDDNLQGGAGNDTLDGGDGVDTLDGGIDNDTLIGGKGDDILVGGPGTDRFVYNTERSFVSADIGIDTITGFASNQDQIVLDKTTFTAIENTPGTDLLKSSQFAMVDVTVSLELSTVGASDALIVFNKQTGNLYYNANGVDAGLGSGAQFAKFVSSSQPSATNFIVQP